MNRGCNVAIVIITLLSFSQNQCLSETLERPEVPLRCTWKLEDLYASDEAWNEAKEALAAEFDKVL